MHVAEQASGTREGERHVPYIPKDLVPFFDADPLLVRGADTQDLFEAGRLVSGQAHHHVDCVQYPTE